MASIRRVATFAPMTFRQGVSRAPVASRSFSTSVSTFARKDTQDKDSLSPRSTEYSQSGTDDAAAANPDAAFNPNKTSPEEIKDTAEKESNGNPLEVSPGNLKDTSKAKDPRAGGAQQAPNRGPSGGGSPNKAGGGKSG